MDLEGGGESFGGWDKIDEVGGVVVQRLCVAVFADPVLEFGKVHPVHVTPRSLGLAAPLPLFDEREHLLAARLPL